MLGYDLPPLMVYLYVYSAGSRSITFISFFTFLSILIYMSVCVYNAPLTDAFSPICSARQASEDVVAHVFICTFTCIFIFIYMCVCVCNAPNAP